MPSPRTVLLVTCHPDPRSLNGTLRDHAIDVLMRQGHRVEQSDLYAMKWKAVVDLSCGKAAGQALRDMRPS